jgi:6-pyruvoyl-tetrahydropterin synthase
VANASARTSEGRAALFEGENAQLQSRLNDAQNATAAAETKLATSEAKVSSLAAQVKGKTDTLIAHQKEGPTEFGPAQNLHGATYTVDVDFATPSLVDKSNWVIDIGAASDILAEVLKKYNFQNLDSLFPSENTTTEFMCRAIHNDLSSRLKSKCWSGGLRVKLHESHKAWAEFAAPV